MSFLCLVWCGSLSRADSPHRFISNDNLTPVVDIFSNGTELSCIDVIRFACFSFIEFLTNASNYLEIIVKGVLNLLANNVI